jgi:hypothetical protein
MRLFPETIAGETLARGPKGESTTGLSAVTPRMLSRPLLPVLGPQAQLHGVRLVGKN